MSTKDAISVPAFVSAAVLAALLERLVIALTAITATGQVLRICPLADGAGLRVEGELDRTALPDLRQALGSMASGGFCVDLGGLAFIDLGGLRALVSAGAALYGGDGDRHVLTLRSVPPHVRRLLVLTGWHQAPGLHLQAPTRPG
ncbi:STAS domain-containing protein [Nonomuraea sp. NPDC050643]|uniref:STAS domain-containing protein n=1 Tax=Nonomuraea sp. NPDC050643 TaxID=3155660 RepID=UPI0033EF177C